MSRASKKETLITVSRLLPLKNRGGCAIFLLLTASAFPAESGSIYQWSPREDLDFYKEKYRESHLPDFSVFPAYLNAAMQSKKYRQYVDVVSNMRCIEWISFHSIEVQASKYQLIFFCKKNNGTWEGVLGDVASGEITRMPISKNKGEIDRLIFEGISANEIHYFPAFDASCEYATVFNGKKINRLAMYGGNASAGNDDHMASAAKDFFRKIKVLREALLYKDSSN